MSDELKDDDRRHIVLLFIVHLTFVHVTFWMAKVFHIRAVARNMMCINYIQTSNNIPNKRLNNNNTNYTEDRQSTVDRLQFCINI